MIGETVTSRVAIVTAAANGIGAATAATFAEAGHRLVLVDIDHEGLAARAAALDEAGSAVETITADVIREGEAEAAATAALRAFGRIDVLANVVGGSRPGQTVVDLDRADWDRIIALNLSSTFLMCKAVLPHMEQAGAGAIVNVSSGAGLHGMQRNPAYVAAKAGVAALTRALAIDHGPRGVRVNCVAPGPVLTPLMRMNRTPEEIDFLARRTLAGHVADPMEIARVIVWLASDAASYVMGQTISVDGGGISGI